MSCQTRVFSCSCIPPVSGSFPPVELSEEIRPLHTDVTAAWAFAVGEVTQGLYTVAPIVKWDVVGDIGFKNLRDKSYLVERVLLLPVGDDPKTAKVYGVVGSGGNLVLMPSITGEGDGGISYFSSNMCKNGTLPTTEAALFHIEEREEVTLTSEQRRELRRRERVFPGLRTDAQSALHEEADVLKALDNFPIPDDLLEIRLRRTSDHPWSNLEPEESSQRSIPAKVVEQVLAHEIDRAVTSSCNTRACEAVERVMLNRLQDSTSKYLRKIAGDVRPKDSDELLPFTLPDIPLPSTREARRLLETAQFIGSSAEWIHPGDVSRTLTTLLSSPGIDPEKAASQLGTHIGIATVAGLEQLAEDRVRTTFGPLAAEALRNPIEATKKAILHEVDTAIRSKAEGMLKNALERKIGPDVMANFSTSYADVQQAAALAGDLSKLLSGDATEATLVEIAYKTLGTMQFAKQGVLVNFFRTHR